MHEESEIALLGERRIATKVNAFLLRKPVTASAKVKCLLLNDAQGPLRDRTCNCEIGAPPEVAIPAFGMARPLCFSQFQGCRR
jgi:hypothetical protein